MEHQIELPSNNMEMLNFSGINCYVREIFSTTEVRDKLLVCKRLLENGDPFYMFEHSSSFVSVIANDKAAPTNLMLSFDLLYTTVEKLGQCLAMVLTCGNPSQATQPIDNRSKYLTLTKMTLFLQINTVRRIDDRMEQIVRPKAQNESPKEPESLEDYKDWNRKRAKFLKQLYYILQFPLEKLWSTPTVDEKFVHLACNICYRTLELAYPPLNIRVARTVFQILGTSIKRYNHAFKFPERILQMVRNVDKAIPFVAFGINLLCEQYCISRIFSVIIMKIEEGLQSNDAAVANSYSNFFVHLSRTYFACKQIVPILMRLSVVLLTCDSPMVRHCTVRMIGNAIVDDLTEGVLSEEDRNKFLDKIKAHLSDKSRLVRAKVLLVFINMRKANAIPLSYQVKIIWQALELLEESSPIVRKRTVKLIKEVLLRHPFAAKLTREDLVARFKEESTVTEKVRKASSEAEKEIDKFDYKWHLLLSVLIPILEQFASGNTEEFVAKTKQKYEGLVQSIFKLFLGKKYLEVVEYMYAVDAVVYVEWKQTLNLDGQVDYCLSLFKYYTIIVNGIQNNEKQMDARKRIAQFIEAYIDIYEFIKRATKKIEILVLTNSESELDVSEAVDFYTMGFKSSIKCAEVGIRCLMEISSVTDLERRATLSKAFTEMIFRTSQTGATRINTIVKNLIRFFDTIERAHCEEFQWLMHLWISNELIDESIMKKLFECFTLSFEGITEKESESALELLLIGAREQLFISPENLNVFEAIGLGKRGREHPHIFSGCLELLMRSEPDSQIILEVVTIFQIHFFHSGALDFKSLCMHTLNFIYHLCAMPDLVCYKMLTDINENLKKFSVEFRETASTASQQVAGTKSSSSPQDITVFLLTRFIYLLGSVAHKEMMYLEEISNSEIQQINENMDFIMGTMKRSVQLKPDENLMDFAMETMERKMALLNLSTENQTEPDEDSKPSKPDKEKLTALKDMICDNLLYNDKISLSKYVPWVVEICADPVSFNNLSLQQAAVHTLIRLMCVSSTFCKAQMPLLIKVLTNTESADIKFVIIVGMMNLTFRFPDILTLWTGFLYTELHSNDDKVRLITMKVIHQLITRKIVENFKSYLPFMAVCIVDARREVANIARKLFDYLGESKVLLNNFVEIIIQMKSFNLEYEKYFLSVGIILEILQQTCSGAVLVEMLCKRFVTAKDEDECSGLSQGLSLMIYNRSSIKILLDNFPQYESKLRFPEVADSFNVIIVSTLQGAKGKLKIMTKELRKRVLEIVQAQYDNYEEEQELQACVNERLKLPDGTGGEH